MSIDYVEHFQRLIKHLLDDKKEKSELTQFIRDIDVAIDCFDESARFFLNSYKKQQDRLMSLGAMKTVIQKELRKLEDVK